MDVNLPLGRERKHFCVSAPPAERPRQAGEQPLHRKGQERTQPRAFLALGLTASRAGALCFHASSPGGPLGCGPSPSGMAPGRPGTGPRDEGRWAGSTWRREQAPGSLSCPASTPTRPFSLKPVSASRGPQAARCPRHRAAAQPRAQAQPCREAAALNSPAARPTQPGTCLSALTCRVGTRPTLAGPHQD